MSEDKDRQTSPKKSTNNSKVFDVAHPSKTTAQGTSKPVIVGHTNTIQNDPMVSSAKTEKTENASSEPQIKIPDEKVEESVDKASSSETPKREKVIKPITENFNKQQSSSGENLEDGASSQTSVESEPVVNEPNENNTSQDVDVSSKEVDVSDQNQNGDSVKANAVDAVAENINTKKQRLAEEENASKADQEINNLIESKKYNVKINTPARQRKIGWFILAILLVFALLAWYLSMGPGKDLWSKTATNSPAEQSNASANVPAESELDNNPKESNESEKNNIKNFSNADLGISFDYPDDWQVNVAKDPEFETRDLVTLSSPTQIMKSDTSENTDETSDIEVYLRTTIIVENTVDVTEYASDLAGLANCSSQDIVVDNINFKLIFSALEKANPNVTKVSLGSSNCVKNGELFSANDQIQIGDKKNTYQVYSEYVLSDDYLSENGTTDSDAIKLAQSSGVVLKEDQIKADENFKNFVDLLKTFKEL